jgi:hypothetical protein
MGRLWRKGTKDFPDRKVREDEKRQNRAIGEKRPEEAAQGAPGPLPRGRGESEAANRQVYECDGSETLRALPDREVPLPITLPTHTSAAWGSVIGPQGGMW